MTGGMRSHNRMEDPRQLELEGVFRRLSMKASSDLPASPEAMRAAVLVFLNLPTDASDRVLVKEARSRLRLNQQAFAQSIGYAQLTSTSWEKGLNPLSKPGLQAIARVLAALADEEGEGTSSPAPISSILELVMRSTEELVSAIRANPEYDLVRHSPLLVLISEMRSWVSDLHERQLGLDANEEEFLTGALNQISHQWVWSMGDVLRWVHSNPISRIVIDAYLRAKLPEIFD
jgi:DNA-binding XRE family transcriptional regulator